MRLTQRSRSQTSVPACSALYLPTFWVANPRSPPEDPPRHLFGQRSTTSPFRPGLGAVACRHHTRLDFLRFETWPEAAYLIYHGVSASLMWNRLASRPACHSASFGASHGRQGLLRFEIGDGSATRPQPDSNCSAANRFLRGTALLSGQPKHATRWAESGSRLGSAARSLACTPFEWFGSCARKSAGVFGVWQPTRFPAFSIGERFQESLREWQCQLCAWRS